MYTEAAPDPTPAPAAAPPSQQAAKRGSAAVFEGIRGEAANLMRADPALSEAQAVQRVLETFLRLYAGYREVSRAEGGSIE